MAEHHLLSVEVHLVLINTAGEVLFGQRRSAGRADAAWQLPAGELNAGESVVAALIREARAITGVVIDEQDVRFCHVMHLSSGGGQIAFFFAAERWSGEPAHLMPQEGNRLAWFSPAALPYDLRPRCRVALEWIAVNHGFSMFGW